MSTQKGNALVISIVVIVAVATLTAVGYLYYQNFIAGKEQTKSTPATDNQSNGENKTVELTNDQIFEQVSSQLGLTRDKFAYFRIFGQDKVQYSTGLEGATYAYKVSDSWKIAQENAQSIAICSELVQVPEDFRPPCSDSNSTGSDTLYLDSNGRSINYPPSSMVSYIGE